MAQFGEPGSDLKRYKQAGKIGITGSWPSKGNTLELTTKA